MGDTDTGFGHNRQLLIVDLNAMGDAYVVVEHTEFGEVNHRTQAELGNETFGVEFCWRHVEAHSGAMFGCEFATGLPKRVRCSSVTHQDRPGRHSIIACAAVLFELALQERNGLISILLVDRRLRRKVPYPPANPSANSDLVKTVDDLVEEPNGASFEERRSA